jgi:hypothetical protein
LRYACKPIIKMLFIIILGLLLMNVHAAEMSYIFLICFG